MSPIHRALVRVLIPLIQRKDADGDAIATDVLMWAWREISDNSKNPYFHRDGCANFSRTAKNPRP